MEFVSIVNTHLLERAGSNDRSRSGIKYSNRINKKLC